MIGLINIILYIIIMNLNIFFLIKLLIDIIIHLFDFGCVQEVCIKCVRYIIAFKVDKKKF